MLTLPLYKVLAHNYVVSDEILTNGVALEYAKTTDQIMFYWFPTSNQVVVSNLTFVPANTTGEAWTNILPPTSDLYNIIATKSINTAYDLISTKCAPASALGKEIPESNYFCNLFTTLTQGTLFYVHWRSWRRHHFTHK